MKEKISFTFNSCIEIKNFFNRNKEISDHNEKI